MRTLIRKLAGLLGIRWVIARVSDVANGRLGAGLAALYWSLVGLKTWTSVFVGMASAALLSLGYAHAAEVLGTFAGVGVLLGLLDKAWRTPHVPEALANLALYRFLAARSAGITTTLAAALAWTRSTGCAELAVAGLPITCAAMSSVLLVVTAACAYLGLVNEAFEAKPPTPPHKPDFFDGPPSAVAVALVTLLPVIASMLVGFALVVGK